MCVSDPASFELMVKCGVSDFASTVCISEPAAAPPQPLVFLQCTSSCKDLDDESETCLKNDSETLTHHPRGVALDQELEAEKVIPKPKVV